MNINSLKKPFFKLAFLLLTIFSIAIFSFLLIQAEPASAATTLSVNVTSDGTDTTPGDGLCTDIAGDCSLRAAIEEANALAGTDTIEFNILPLDQTTKTIQPVSELPHITDQIVFDGYSQDDSAPNSAVSPNPFNGTLRLEIDGTNVDDILTFEGASSGSAGSEVRGLILNRAQDTAIRLDSRNIKVQGNYIGTSANGSAALPNQVGVNWAGFGSHDDGRDALIGGTAPQDRNIISGNTGGTVASGAYPTSGWVIQGNYFGLAADGVTALGNSTNGGSGGLSVDYADDVVIGGSVTGAGNVISGNLSHGIAPDNAQRIFIQGNLIGTDYTGTVAIGNGAGALGGGAITMKDSNNFLIGGAALGARNVIANATKDGIYLNNCNDGVIQNNYIGTDITGTVDMGVGQSAVAMNNGSSGNLIGGATPGLGNIIANSNEAGVLISDNSDGTTGNTVIGNSIYSNGDLGIDLTPLFGVSSNDATDSDSGANALLNYPQNFQVTISGSNTQVDYDLDVPAGSYRIEFFSNTSADSSTHGEGEAFIFSQNVISAGSGAQPFSAIIPGNSYINISSTATEITASSTGFGSTSEFSAPQGPVTDVELKKVLNNPQDVAVGATLEFNVALTNNGPDAVALNNYTGSGNPFVTSLFIDVIPDELTFISDTSPDVNCTDFAPASVAGPLMANHSTSRIIVCVYVGSDVFLNSGSSISVTYSATVDVGSDLVFENAALNLSTPSDPDAGTIQAAFSSGNDLIDTLNGTVDNVALFKFPIPIPPTTTTTTTTTVVFPTPGINSAVGLIPKTGSNIAVVVFTAFMLAIGGYVLAKRKRKLIRIR